MTTKANHAATEFRGKHVTVMGLGLLGGGLGAARFLAGRGAVVTVTDLRSEGELRPAMDQLGDLPITYHLGEHPEPDFADADLLVVNPSVKEDSPFLAIARQHGTALTTEINLFFERCPAPILGVTGSVGKTTTTGMIGHVLQQAGRRAFVGGNIGRSLLLDLEQLRPDSLVVLELSSFQLQRLDWIKRAPAISVVTNLHPNHLNHHGTIDEYARCKKCIVTNQRATDLAILNADDPTVSAWRFDCPGRLQHFGIEARGEDGAFLVNDGLVLRQSGRQEPICAAADLPLPGPHNLANALACAAACAAVGLTAAKIAAGLRTIRHIEHRLELVGEWRGVRYYNDSKATTPESTITALKAFDAPILLIAGGSSKGLSCEEVAEVAAERAKAVLLIGETAPELAQALHRAASKGVPSVLILPSLDAAVDAARRSAVAGDGVLLSPTTASYDMFTNFEELGRRFKQLVHASHT